MNYRIISTRKHPRIAPEAARFCRKIGLIRPEDKIELLNRLGLTDDELQDLDIRQPLLQEILEWAEGRKGSLAHEPDALCKLEAARRIINYHLQDIDEQLWMLQQHKHVLQRKASVVERLIRLLGSTTKRQAA